MPTPHLGMLQAAAADGGAESSAVLIPTSADASQSANALGLLTLHLGMLQAAAADGGAEASAVLVRNLPPEAGQAQLATFFSGFRLHPNGLQLGFHGPTTRTGQV